MEFADIYEDKTGCRCTGIECIDEFYQASLKNLSDKDLKVEFVKCSVEDYPSDEYIAFLMRVDEITFFDEIDCTDLFDEDTTRNRIMIFQI